MLRVFRKSYLKLLPDVIFASLPGQSVIPCFRMVNLQLFGHPWQRNISIHIKLKLKISIYATSQDLLKKCSYKLLCDVIFLLLPNQSFISCFTTVNLQLVECPWQPNFSNHTKWEQKMFFCVPRSIVKTQFDVAAWHLFLVVSQPVRYSLFNNSQFSIIWIALAEASQITSNWN